MDDTDQSITNRVLGDAGVVIAAGGSRETARTLKKLRWRLIPLLFLLYVVAFLDRINVSFAALTMNHALGITSAQFGLLSGIFFLGYSLFEIPSNLLLHKTGARIWITRILISWGIVAALTGLIRSAHQLYVLRFLLGVAEAGYFPGIILYLTYWFRQRDQARVIALFMTGLPVASIIGAPLSGLILDHIHWLAIDSWRWLLILEALPAIACGVLAYFWLPSRPSDARFLAPHEKDWIAAELSREELEKLDGHSLSALQGLTNRRVWYLATVNFGFGIALYGMTFFMPQAVKALSSHYSNTLVGALVMVPHLAGLTAMILVSRDSDRKLERRYHAAIPAMVGGFALILVGRANSPWVALALWSSAAAGIYSYIPPFFSMPSEFLGGFSAASGIALITSIGNMGGFVGPFAVGAIIAQMGGRYAGLALAGVPILASATLLLLLPSAVQVRVRTLLNEGELTIT